MHVEANYVHKKREWIPQKHTGYMIFIFNVSYQVTLYVVSIMYYKYIHKTL